MVSRDHSLSGFDQSTFARLGELGQDRCDGAGVPRVRVLASHTDRALGVEAFSGRLLGAGRDPTEHDRRDDPSPLHVRETPHRCAVRNAPSPPRPCGAAAMAAAVARRCHASSIAVVTSPIAGFSSFAGDLGDAAVDATGLLGVRLDSALPILAVGRDHFAQDVLRLVHCRWRLDADAGDEAQTIEIAYRLDLPRLLAVSLLSLGPDAAGLFQDRPDLGAAISPAWRVPCGRAGDGNKVQNFRLAIRTVDNDEFAVERLAVAVLGAPAAAVLAGTAGPDVQLQRRDRVLGDHLEVALRCRHR